MPPAAVPTPATPAPATSANEVEDAARPLLSPLQPARDDTTFRDRGHTPEYSRPRESSRDHPRPSNTSMPALSSSLRLSASALTSPAPPAGQKTSGTPAQKSVLPPVMPPPARRSDLQPLP